jgi:chromosome segregation ATPase
MTRTYEDRIDAALEAFEKGFESEAARKRALDDLNRAYNLVRDEQRDALRARAPYEAEHNAMTATEEQSRERMAFLYADENEVPYDLHQVREKHADRFGDLWSKVERLVELRAAIKAAEIVKAAPSENEVLAERVQKSIREIMERRQAQYATGLELQEVFGRLPVTMNVHVVHGHKGAVFLRTFYYMNGKLTPLNVILAVLQAKEEEEA